MDLEGHTRKVNNISGYRHKYKGFCEKFIFPKSIDKRRTTIIRVPMRA